MVSEDMSAELALKYVQRKHPPAWPNDGFRYQLKLFEGVHTLRATFGSMHPHMALCAPEL